MNQPSNIEILKTKWCYSSSLHGRCFYDGGGRYCRGRIPHLCRDYVQTTSRSEGEGTGTSQDGRRPLARKY